MMRPKNSDCSKTGVYAIRCLVHGATYVGATRQAFEKRWHQHRSLLMAGKHPLALLQEDWRQYGSDAFEFSVLEPVDNLSEAAAYELKWIKHFRSGGHLCYNIVPGRFPQRQPQSYSSQKPGYALPPALCYTVKEVANFWIVPPRVVMNLLRMGKLEGFKVGKSWRVRREVLVGFVENRQKPTTEVTPDA